MFEFEENLSSDAKIKIVGVGGGGGNALKTMMRAQLDHIDFIAINTDIQALKQNEAAIRVQIGKKLTRGLGAGANPDVGRNAALEDATMISEALSGTDMIFITAGMGGGTGTGAAPIIANVAREMGILTVGIVTKPFSFEGRKRMRHAEEGIESLRKAVDTLICIPNDKLLNLAGKETPMIDSFKMADHVLLQAVRSISDLITIPGLINLDFADVKTIMSDAGIALMGTGIAAGENRAIEAAKMAISSPLLENISIAGATGILLNITGPSTMTLFEVNEASKLVQQEAHEDANIIFGSVVNDSMKDEIRVTVIATGFDKAPVREERGAERATAFFPKSWLNYKKDAPNDTRPILEKRPALPAQEPEYDQPQTRMQSTFQAAPSLAVGSPQAMGHTPLARPAGNESIRSVFAESQSEAPDRQKSITPSRDQEFSFMEEVEEIPVRKPAASWGSPQIFQPTLRTQQQQQGARQIELPSARPPVTTGAALGESVDQFPSRAPTRRQQELSEMKKMIAELKTNAEADDEYDIPAFIRRRAD